MIRMILLSLLLLTLSAVGESASAQYSEFNLRKYLALSRSTELAEISTLLSSKSDLERAYGFWRMRRLLDSDKRGIHFQGIENFQIAKQKQVTISKIDKALSSLPLEKDLRSKLIQSGLFEEKENGDLEPKK